MSTGTRVPLAEAEPVAHALVNALTLGCERIEVAGSIRRGRPDVGDIEIVAVPTLHEVPDGMFATQTANRLTERIDELIGRGVLDEHPTDPKRGEKYSKLLHPASGLQLDLFSATMLTWGVIFLIRTGPGDYSHRFVTDLRRRGLHVASGALHKGGLGCGKYLCEIVPTPEEADVYRAAGWPFIVPENRA